MTDPEFYVPLMQLTKASYRQVCEYPVPGSENDDLIPRIYMAEFIFRVLDIFYPVTKLTLLL